MSKQNPTTRQPKGQVITEAVPAAGGQPTQSEKEQASDANPDGGPAGPAAANTADAGAGQPGPASAQGPTEPAAADAGAPPASEPESLPVTDGDQAGEPPAEAGVYRFLDGDAENPTPEERAQALTMMKAELRRMPAGVREAFLQAAAEVAAELPREPKAEAATVKRVKVLKGFPVRYNGQKFHLNTGGIVANPEFAQFLAEGNYPVQVLKDGDDQ